MFMVRLEQAEHSSKAWLESLQQQASEPPLFALLARSLEGRTSQR